MVQSLAIELAHRNILVNAISPGFIETKLTFKNNSPEIIAQLIEGIPLKKLGQPKHIADLTYFLCSEKNSFITGQNIIIDGGYLAGGFQA
jgi:3-oxoacyl-[acyl-carrier protein] reductase